MISDFFACRPRDARHPLTSLRHGVVTLALCASLAGVAHADDVYRVDYLSKWTSPAGNSANLRYVADLEGADEFYYATTNALYRLDFANLGSAPTLSLGISVVPSSSFASYAYGSLFLLNGGTYDAKLYNLTTGTSSTSTTFSSPLRLITSVYSVEADYVQTADTLNVPVKSLLYTATAGGRTGIYYSQFAGTSFGSPVEVYSTPGTKAGQQVWLSNDGTTIYLWDPSASASGTDNFLRTLKLENGAWTLQSNPVQLATRSYGTFSLANDGTFFLWTGAGAGVRYAADGTLLASFAAPSPGTASSNHNINYNSDTGKLVVSDGSGIYGFQAVAPVAVTSAADSGAGTLRQAINDVVTGYRHSENAKFAALFDGPQTITLASSLDPLDGSSGPFAIEPQTTLTVNSGNFTFLDLSGAGLVYEISNVENRSTSADAIKVRNGAILYATKVDFDNLTLNGGIFRTGTALATAGHIFLSPGGGTFDVTAGTTTLSGLVSGDGALTKTGAGTLTLTGASTYTGATTINAGTLVVNGSLPASSAVAINSGGTLSGHGTVGAIALNSGGTISPGNSPGTLTTGDEAWAGGGSYVWELNDASDTTDAKGVTYDWLNIDGALNIAATSGGKFTIYITSLIAGNAAGTTPGFNYGRSYRFIIASATNIVGFDPDKFSINTSAFSNDPGNGGGFTISQIGNDLVLTYTAVPEPSVWGATMGAALLGMVFLRQRNLSKQG